MRKNEELKLGRYFIKATQFAKIGVIRQMIIFYAIHKEKNKPHLINCLDLLHATFLVEKSVFVYGGESNVSEVL